MKQRGVSLVEVLLVITILGALAFLIGSVPNSIILVGQSKHTSIAREIVSKDIEDLRAMQYANLTNGQVNLTDLRISSLPNGTATRLIEDCPTTLCTNSEHTKQITETVNFKDGGKNQSIVVKTLISEGGLNK